jgi:bacterial/archaeal transporter family protein
MYLWFWLTLISGIVFGFYDIYKKKAMEKSALLNVLFLHSFFCFVIVAFTFPNAFTVSYQSLGLILLKSLFIFFSWILGFLALRNMAISIFTPLATLTPVFSIILGFLVLQERMSWLQWIGILIILAAFYFIGKADAKDTKASFKNKDFLYVVASCFLAALNALTDKITLKTTTPGQMQFWFYLFLSFCYLGAFFYQRSKNRDCYITKFNWEILWISLFLVVSDWLYFTALKDPHGQISIILPLRRVSVLVSTIYGGIIFKEKNLKVKFAYLCLVIIGIVIVFISK